MKSIRADEDANINLQPQHLSSLAMKEVLLAVHLVNLEIWG